MEKSRAIKAPSIPYHLVGAKKVKRTEMKGMEEQRERKRREGEQTTARRRKKKG